MANFDLNGKAVNMMSGCLSITEYSNWRVSQSSFSEGNTPFPKQIMKCNGCLLVLSVREETSMTM